MSLLMAAVPVTLGRICYLLHLFTFKVDMNNGYKMVALCAL